MSSAGSPKNFVGALLLPAPAGGAGSRPRSPARCCRTCSAASAACLPISSMTARRSFRSRISIWSSPASRSSSAQRKAMLSTPSCGSVSSSRRESSSGPISCTVARTGWPCSPKMSQNADRKGGVAVARQADLLGALDEVRLAARPRRRCPTRSPLMSAANTGTPAAEKPSASTCSVTVLPVPVAPVTSPWRLASFSSMHFRSRPALLTADQDVAVLHIVARIGGRLVRPWLLVRHPHLLLRRRRVLPSRTRNSDVQF